MILTQLVLAAAVASQLAPVLSRQNLPGPRWGLVQNDGRVPAVGILYASYLGGSVKSVLAPRPTAPRVVGPNPWVSSTQTVTLYTEAQPPATPKLEELPLKESVAQYGMTWSFGLRAAQAPQVLPVGRRHRDPQGLWPETSLPEGIHSATSPRLQHS
ncbi:MAG TPA: hypothetical protein PKM43_02980 [Verrucomicrobiota bacterium]|nr:hypothetical protein [Verrucomicrobiota bacterium]